MSINSTLFLDLYHYPKFKLALDSDCESNIDGLYRNPIGDSIELEVSWLESCPTVQWGLVHKILLDSGNPWRITQSSAKAPNQEVTVYNPNFYSYAWRTNDRLNQVILQYRRPNDAVWTDAMQLNVDGTESIADFIPSEDAYGYSTLTMKADHLQDGEYVLRVLSKCQASVPPNAALDSHAAPQIVGFIDRSPPVQFGFPEPVS